MMNRDSRRTVSVASWVSGIAVIGAVVGLAALAACSKGDATKTAFDAAISRPDTYPIMLNKDMPFRYPPALYAEKVQGNVTLRLYVDKDGTVVDDSTRVIESANIPTLDSAAIKGSRELKFEPAKLRGTPMPVSILFPVYFRHPDAPQPPGDSMFRKPGAPAVDSTRPAPAASAAPAKKSTSSSAKTKRKRR